MIIGRAPILGLLGFLLLSASACTSGAAAPEAAPAAVPRYTAPQGAPVVCERLADLTHFTDIPAAVGRLAAGTGGAEAERLLAEARNELRAMVAELPDGSGKGPEAAADAVVAALRQVLDRPHDAEGRAALVTGVEEFVAALRPLCGYPA